jgi:hypothetical protein
VLELDQQDDSDEEFDGLVYGGRGDGDDDDHDECAACGDQMPEYYTGDGGGGNLCPDCDVIDRDDDW